MVKLFSDQLELKAVCMKPLILIHVLIIFIWITIFIMEHYYLVILHRLLYRVSASFNFTSKNVMKTTYCAKYKFNKYNLIFVK